MKPTMAHWLIMLGTLILLSAALCNTAQGAHPKTVGVVEGDTVPFTGVLVDPGTFAEIMHERLDLDGERVRAMQCLRHVEDVNAALDQATRKRPWYDSPIFRSVAGFVLGAGVVILAYEGASRNCCPR